MNNHSVALSVVFSKLVIQLVFGSLFVVSTHSAYVGYVLILVLWCSSCFQFFSHLTEKELTGCFI